MSTDLGTEVETIESIKSPECWRIILMTETKMPFSYCMGGVSSLLEELGHYVHIGWDTGRHGWLNIHVLAPYSITHKIITFL